MAQARPANSDGCSIRVGTTGTISSLMSRELESLKHVNDASGSSSKKRQSAPVSIPCGASPRILQLKRNPPNEHRSCSSSNHYHHNNKDIGNIISKFPSDAQKQMRSGHQIPILSTENTTADKTKTKVKPDKKGSYIVEVVDLKCNNPMSGRLRKLGFSKLSESVV